MTVEREEYGSPVGRPRSPRSGNSDWLTGSRITAVQGVFYRPEGRAGEPEAVEFVIDRGESVLLTCTSDWTLCVTPGAWPLLPDWCVPANQWQHAPLTQLPPVPHEGGWTVVGTLERTDGCGEVHEAVIRCREGDFVVAAGDTLAVRFHPH
ncbi:hypothetical protein DBP19_22230 [Streptomyces sp. CS090A]|uniref:hypothetical protein n=1 Tax=Streptomyces TaxID=1883 RepID=UPI000D50C39F|nr:hypothetical protein [Streptomyces sp. CS090A]PVC89322.1 hypothetical protein DBP19_22230 [Streptomyces sp. CS090A]